jgi:hypothetical protein
MPALLGLLGQLRRSAGVDLDLIVRRLPFTVNRGEVSRWEYGESQPPTGRVDQVVHTYAAETGAVVLAIWGEALTRSLIPLQFEEAMRNAPPLIE